MGILLILLIDDEEEIANALRRYLSVEGYLCEWTHDGNSAIERLTREPVPDLVLLDYRMPGVDGLEVLRSIRIQPLTTHLPVVMMSGDLQQCPAEAQALLEKPFEMAELLAEIERFVVRSASD